MDPKSEALLQTYRKEVEKVARGAYLQAIAIRKDVDFSKVNPEDKAIILLNCINLLTKQANEAPKPEKPNQQS